jgi:hypothetical protein
MQVPSQNSAPVVFKFIGQFIVQISYVIEWSLNIKQELSTVVMVILTDSLSVTSKNAAETQDAEFL